MWRYVCKRLLLMIPVLLGVSFLIFTLLYLTPGDPARVAKGEMATEEVLQAWRVEQGLDKPFIVQYVKYIVGIVTRGDFGTSYRTGRPVSAELFARFPTTFLLACLAALLALVVGLTLGIFSANHRDTWIDSLVRIFGMLGASMPIFWFALLLIMLFSQKLGWLPASGFYGPSYWIMPAMALGLMYTASLMRVTRSAMLDCTGQDYVRTARAKGQKEFTITMHHVLRNAMIPIITAFGGLFGVALGGAMIMEQIFSIPGLGSLMVMGINNRDYPQVRGSVLLLAFSFSMVNLLVDVVYAMVDPRIKAQYAGSARKRVKVKPIEAENTDNKEKEEDKA